MRFRTLISAGALATLAACGRETPAENMAETLEEAAEQSTPEAAEVLENGAARIREENITDPEYPLRVLDEAGNAQVPPLPPTRQAEPPLPPPEIRGNGQ